MQLDLYEISVNVCWIYSSRRDSRQEICPHEALCCSSLDSWQCLYSSHTLQTQSSSVGVVLFFYFQNENVLSCLCTVVHWTCCWSVCLAVCPEHELVIVLQELRHHSRDTKNKTDGCFCFSNLTAFVLLWLLFFLFQLVKKKTSFRSLAWCNTTWAILTVARSHGIIRHKVFYCERSEGQVFGASFWTEEAQHRLYTLQLNQQPVFL